MGDAPELVNDVAYYGPKALFKGGNAATGGIGTFAPDKRILDLAGVVPSAPVAARVAKTAANPMTYANAFGESMAPAVMSQIKAYHGTPHKVDKFSMDKIGTGEGQQVYGHGLYFADNPAVAESYKKALSQGLDRPLQIDGVPTESKVARQILERYIKPEYYILEMGKKLENLKADLPKKSKEDVLGIGLSDFDVYSMEIRGVERDLQEAQSLIGKKINKGDPGNLYTVDIPDEAVGNMLLWDKPFFEQSDVVKNALSAIDKPTTVEQALAGKSNDEIVKWVSSFDRNNMLRDVLDEDPSLNTEDLISIIKENYEGQDLGRYLGSSAIEPSQKAGDLYRSLIGKLGTDKNVSSALLERGVPGVRYFDGISRMANSGTMNTVVFDDNLIKILEENGMPVRGLLD
jgi:hypothetical protein